MDETLRSDAKVADLLQYFSYDHLPPHLQTVSAPFAALATQLAETLPANTQRTRALEKLLEAKDCAVRASLPSRPTTAG